MTGAPPTLPGPPHALDRARFVAAYGGVFEHSPWIAEAAWDAGLGAEHADPATLHAAMAAALDRADDGAKLALIRAHPDLAAKAAARDALTDSSRAEQASAGLDACTPEELARFERLNAAYREKFGFPFVMAVKGRSRREILAAFERRLANSRAEEFRTALDEIKKIALLRLLDLARDGAPSPPGGAEDAPESGP